MIQKTFIVHDESETFELLASAKLYSLYQNARSTFAFLSCSNATHIQMQQVGRVLKSAYPGIKLIACSQAVNDGDKERCTVRISFFYFDDAEVETCTLDYNTLSREEVFHRVKMFLNSHDHLKGVCIMSIGGDIGTRDFLEKISEPFPEVPFFGGLAGDPVDFKLPEDQSGFVMTDTMKERVRCTSRALPPLRQRFWWWTMPP